MMAEEFDLPTEATEAGDASDVEITIDEAVARGQYSNLVLVSHTPSELTLDFAYLQPTGAANVQARIIMTQANARELIAALVAHLAETQEVPSG